MVQFTGGRSVSEESGGVQPVARPDDLSGHAHRQLLGYIGLIFPVILVFLVLSRDGLSVWRSLDSISAYYYTGAVPAFVGMLVAMALFLLTYRGFENKFYWADRTAGIIAGIAALGVAVFPTGAPTADLELAWWRPATGIIHYVSAIVLFLMFAVYALWLFRLGPEGEQASPSKRRRNIVYLVCGIAIIASIVWAGIAGYLDRSIFWPESVALVAFSISWLVKGYALRTIGNIARRLVGRPPQRIV